MQRWYARMARQLGALVATVIVGGVLTATLVRTGPGFDSDERLMDPRLDAASRAAIQAEHDADRDLPRFYLRHVGGMLRGDLGTSSSLKTPIGELIRSRLP